MAGIGFILRRLTRRDDILGLVQGYAYSALITAGPWLFTVFALAGLSALVPRTRPDDGMELFRLIVAYNFCFSLVLSGPLLLVLTRYLADAVYAKQVTAVPGAFVAAYAGVLLAGFLGAIPFYGFYAVLDLPTILAALLNYALTAGVFLVGVFLTALKDYRSVTRAFCGGMVVAFLAAWQVATPETAWPQLLGFSLGLAVIFFPLAARVFAEYPYPLEAPTIFLSYFKRYRDLALIGLVANMAIWVDKWVLWFAPEATEPYHKLISYPAHDGAMFLAQLCVVPALSVFMVNVETVFFEHYKRYYSDIQHHASLDRIRLNQRELAKTLILTSRNIAVLQACVAALCILVSPRLVDWGLLTADQLGMFRFGVLGASFQVMLSFCLIVLAYLDRRQDLLWIQALSLVLNGVLSWVTMQAGFGFYGYGFFLASLICLVVGYVVVTLRLRDLLYLTFIGQNPSVREVK